VVAGLYVSWNGLSMISARRGLQGIFFWDSLLYLIEGMVFPHDRLQARTSISLGTYRCSVLAARMRCQCVVIGRFVMIFPATYLPRWLFPAIARNDPSPPWQWPFMLGSPASAVSCLLPRRLPFHSQWILPAFPDRDLILFLHVFGDPGDACGPGLMLPAVIGARPRQTPVSSELQTGRAEELLARRHAIEAAIERLGAARRGTGTA